MTSSSSDLLKEYPNLRKVVSILDGYLVNSHSSYFGEKSLHPHLPIKRAKVIHDSLWGTVRFTWRELVLIDSPLMQRLRDIHQTGLAFHVYPSAQHTRFEHSLGVATISSRIYDSLLHKNRNDIKDIARATEGYEQDDSFFFKLKQEMRLAALLHDTGHSLFSHTSELVYEKLDIVSNASLELTNLSGKKKGAGEVLSFCFALTPSVQRILEKAGNNLLGKPASDDYEGEINLTNVALYIIGRSPHPFLQFIGDIISSGFDADKLDYLFRDATTAGLPLSYDIDRYLYDVQIKPEQLADGEGKLKNLYSLVSKVTPKQNEPSGTNKYPHYDTYRLRLSQRAMNVVEQIIICKMMLFSYIYHHAKCRASEGLLQRLLSRCVEHWRAEGITDDKILEYFIEMTDSSARNPIIVDINDEIIRDYSYRINNRLVPREIFSFCGNSGTHASSEIVKETILDVHDPTSRDAVIENLENKIGARLIELDPDLGPEIKDALARAGVWVDAPKPPKFEDINEVVSGENAASSDTPLADIFPIREWTQAYQNYRYHVRIYAFSEYCKIASDASEAAMKEVFQLSGDSFFRAIERNRN